VILELREKSISWSLRRHSASGRWLLSGECPASNSELQRVFDQAQLVVNKANQALRNQRESERAREIAEARARADQIAKERLARAHKARDFSQSFSQIRSNAGISGPPLSWRVKVLLIGFAWALVAGFRDLGLGFHIIGVFLFGLGLSVPMERRYSSKDMDSATVLFFIILIALIMRLATGKYGI
jgi:hypothetical protein